MEQSACAGLGHVNPNPTPEQPDPSDTTDTRHRIVIADQGWIFIGHALPPHTPVAPITLTNASVVWSWSNGKGIGGLAEDPDGYTLDPVGTLT